MRLSWHDLGTGRAEAAVPCTTASSGARGVVSTLVVT
jgi:hypothetical protein